MGRVATTLAVVCVAGVARAGPWAKERGAFYLKVGESLFVGGAYRDRAGRTVSGVDYLGATTLAYFELGLGRGMQLIGVFPHVVARNRFDDGSRFLRASGGDAILGAQVTVGAAPFPLAMRVDAKVPLYDTGGADARFPEAGDGQLDLTAWISAGGSLPDWPVYAFAEVGYRARTSVFLGDAGPDYADTLALFGQAGVTLAECWLVVLNLGGAIALGRDAVTRSFVSLGPAVQWRWAHGLAIEAGVDPVVYANNASAGFGVSVGFSWTRAAEGGA